MKVHQSIMHLTQGAVMASAFVYTMHKKITADSDAAEAPAAIFTKDSMPMTGATLQAIVNLSAQYFVVYTGVALFRTLNQLQVHPYFGMPWSIFQRLFESAASTVNYCPMLCVLFLGCRMRAEQLTNKDTEKYHLPDEDTQFAMTLAAYAVLVQVALVLLMPVFTGEYSVPVDADGNVDLGLLESRMNKSVMTLLTLVRYATLAGLYGGAVFVVVKIHLMEAPSELKALFPDGTPPVSPAVGATINLTSQFFFIYFMLALVRTIAQFSGASQALRKLEATFSMAAYTVNMAPMLCILFIGARMRALQIDPVHGSPQPWAQNCFWLCTYSIMIQCLLVIILPYSGSNVTCLRGDFEGDIKFQGLSGPGATVLVVLRYLALFALYGGFTAVCYSVFTIESPLGPAATPKLSVAMACVMCLTATYFFIYAALFLTQTIRSYLPESKNLSLFAQMMDTARACVMYAPMLAVMFIGARMRALQLAKTTEGDIPKTAGPPVWVQDCMVLATWSILIQVVLVCVLSALYPVEMDADGNVKTPKNAGKVTGYILNGLRYGCMIAMYGGACTILYGTLTMTPELVQPYAYSPLIPGVELPRPPTPDEAAPVPGVSSF